MRRTHTIVSLTLALLLLATVYGLVRTGRESTIPLGNIAANTPEQAPLVDQTPLLTAQRLARMPTSPAEVSSAQEALQFGDQEMDLAFALAILDATEHPPAMSSEAKAIDARLQKAEDALAAEQARVAQLNA